MKKNIVLFVLSLTLVLVSAQFEIVSGVKELSGDLTAQRYPYKDVNGDWCAILKINSDIEGLTFEGMGYEKHDELGKGMYRVYMQPGSKRLKLVRSGFVAKQIEFPEKLKSNSVYQTDIAAQEAGKTVGEIAITVQSIPAGAQIYIDGISKGTNEQIKIPVGKHSLKLIMDGYASVSKDIEVSPEKTLFKYEMEKVQDVLLEVSSVPAGAEISLDGVLLGETPKSVYYTPGKYTLKLKKKGFSSVEDTVELEGSSLKKNYSMQDIRATLTINSDPDADVFIDGEKITELKNIKIAPKYITIEAKKDKSATVTKKILLKKNDVQTVDIFPDLQTRDVKVDVSPWDADIKLWEKNGAKYDNHGSTVFHAVPVGTYTLQVIKEGYKSYKQDIKIEPGSAQIIKNIALIEGSDVPDGFVFVEGGTFTMGGYEEDESIITKEGQQPHSVTLSDFYIGKYEVTQKQWKSVMGKNPVTKERWEKVYTGYSLETINDNYPVFFISWYDAVKFCNKMSEKEGLEKCYKIYQTKEDKDAQNNTGDEKYTVECNFKAKGYRLPTEAEWEYAARGGKKSRNFIYSGSNTIGDVSFYQDNCSKPMPVGGKKANELGIYDMSGNVSEYCWDWYKNLYYTKSPSENPTGPEEGWVRCRRGGDWIGSSVYSRVDNRESNQPFFSGYSYGFRIVKGL